MTDKFKPKEIEAIKSLYGRSQIERMYPFLSHLIEIDKYNLLYYSQNPILARLLQTSNSPWDKLMKFIRKIKAWV